jgi:exodeoxyribonuclease VII small subunit
LEEGQLGLDAALAKYEQGVKLLRTCHDLLQRAERRIQLLAGLDAEGNPIGTPLDDPSLSLDEKSKQRSRRRTSPTSSAPPPGPGLDDDNPAIDEGWPIS